MKYISYNYHYHFGLNHDSIFLVIKFYIHYNLQKELLVGGTEFNKLCHCYVCVLRRLQGVSFYPPAGGAIELQKAMAYAGQ